MKHGHYAAAQLVVRLSAVDDSAKLRIWSLIVAWTPGNGGHLVSPVPGEFSHYVASYGLEQAVKIARFTNATLEKMHKLAADANEYTKKAAEVRRVRSVVAFKEQHFNVETEDSIAKYEEHVPEARGSYRLLDAEAVTKEYGFRDCVGGLEEPSGAFWPYRLITGTYEALLSDHSSRFSVETETPVFKITSTEDGDYPFTLTTPRGLVKAKHVIHCTNGHASHLLPGLRGLIYPLRGTMSTQSPHAGFPNLGNKLSWALQIDPSYDAQKTTVEAGLYYITQNAKSGDIFIGGEYSNILEVLSSDDSKICETTKQNIMSVLPRIFKQYKEGTVKSVWSGILAFTADGLPLVGQLPGFITHPDCSDTARVAGNQWIAAGFNGYGMPQCWGAGEAVAKLLLGGPKARSEVFEWLPEAFAVTEERFDWKNGSQAGLNSFLEMMGLNAVA